MSTVVNFEGAWTWFTTFAAPEMYESNLYEIAMDWFVDPSNTSMTKSVLKEKTKSERLEILKKSPALSARLFHYKQDALWEKVLKGESNLLGEVVDWWRRVEF